MEYLYYILCGLVVFVLRKVFFRKTIKDKSGHEIPPGPLLRYPFLGQYCERDLHAWSQKYGPIFSVFMGSQLFVIVNDPVIARDLMVSNGAIFSGRWDYYLKNKLILQGNGVTAAGYNEEWRKQRRITNWLLAPKAVNSLGATFDYETHIFIQSIYKATEQGKLEFNPVPFTARFALNNMLTITFGTRTYSPSDPLVQVAIDLGMTFNELTGPLSNAIDFIKPLQWIPTRTRTRGKKLRQDFINAYGSMVQQVKKRMENGEIIPDGLVKSMLERQKEEGLSLTDMCFMANTFTTGGVHTTSVSLQWFLAFMPTHPEIQARAHEELDRVVGRVSWPVAEDEMKLPYIRAIIKEIFRTHPPFWLGTPHCSDADFVYRGMFIPKNTPIVLNSYTIHHNEERYPDPWNFKPERYLGDDFTSTESANLSDPLKRDHFAFGIGRRICPGMMLAERSIFLAVARILWCFTILPVPGEAINLEEYEGTSGRSPMPYKVRLEPRHDNVQSLLEEKKETDQSHFYN